MAPAAQWSRVDDSCRVEDRDVGIGADLDAASYAHSGNGLSKRWAGSSDICECHPSAIEHFC
jgi:hypothetical protein